MLLTYYHQVLLLLKRLTLVYILYFLCRLLFYLANESSFPVISIPRFFENAFYGLRFDTFSIVISNSLFILLSLLPLRIFWHNMYQKWLLWIYMLTNTVFVAFNCIDIGYYRFIRKRSTSEIFDQIGGQSDLGLLLPKFFLDFWWILVCYILMLSLLHFFYKNVKVKGGLTKVSAAFNNKTLQWFSLLFLTALSVIGVRGGLQRVPLDMVNAGSMTTPAEVPIVLNTPFTLIKSMTMSSLEELEFYSEDELKKIYDPVHHFRDSTFRAENVVVLILESFSKEYTRLGLHPGLTPFLDSLMDHSLVFTNGFSNGTKSIEGIPAILSSLPSLMLNPFINSMYANNEQTSFAGLLGEEGYESAFFHGGINGTMNFNDWASLAGYQHYYGKNEYDNNDDFDEYWGIYDEPFLQFAAKRLTDMKEPFHSAIFTLSSHHPYLIPKKYQGLFRKTRLENSESIAYADYSLAQFFHTARKLPWYNNTLFVLVADHCGISENPFYSNIVGNSSIPVLFFKGDNSLKGVNDKVFSQIDILPTVMQYLGYNRSFFSFGNSAFAKEPGANDFMYGSSTHYLYGDSTVYCFNLPKLSQAFNYKRDSLLQHNIVSRDPDIDSLKIKQYKAFIQSYHSTLINNSGRIKKE